MIELFVSLISFFSQWNKFVLTYGKVAPFYLIAVSNEVSTLILYTSLQEENDDENASVILS